jgi:hyperosmotically inducible periplasmic protein
LFFYSKSKNQKEMKLTKFFSAALLVAAISFSVSACKSGPKDEEIAKAIQDKLAASPSTASTTVSVKDGVVTLSGECADPKCKEDCEAATKDVKGVKSVTNNCTVKPVETTPPPASLSTTLDEATQQKVRDGLKDIKSVKVTFDGEKAVLTGEVSKDERRTVMQILASAKVKSDVSKLMDKK